LTNKEKSKNFGMNLDVSVMGALNAGIELS